MSVGPWGGGMVSGAMRLGLSLFLAVMVALSSVTMAAARHQPRAVESVMLCSGLMLEVDAEGNPAGPQLPCPDCAQPVAALTGTPVLPGPALRLVPHGFTLADLSSPPAGARAAHQPRGPPARV